MNLKSLAKASRQMLNRNASKILAGFAIGAGVMAVGFAIEATPKAMILLEEKKAELGVEKLDVKTIVKTAGPVYIPTVVSMGLSTACTIGALKVKSQQNAALAAACTLSETALRTYQNKVVETIGAEKEQEIREAVALDKMAKSPEPAVIPNAKGVKTDDISYDQRVKCWESLSGNYFWTTRNAIERAINGVNKQLLSDFRVTENDLFDYLGILNSAFSIALWGEDRSRGGSNNYYGNNRGQRNSYDGYYQGSQNNRPNPPPVRRSLQNLDFESRGDAEDTLAGLRDALYRYRQVSVGDLWDLMGVTNDSTDYNYGWYNLDDAFIKGIPGGFRLILPHTVPLR